jgi:hypothetical protein
MRRGLCVAMAACLIIPWMGCSKAQPVTSGTTDGSVQAGSQASAALTQVRLKVPGME